MGVFLLRNSLVITYYMENPFFCLSTEDAHNNGQLNSEKGILNNFLFWILLQSLSYTQAFLLMCSILNYFLEVLREGYFCCSRGEINLLSCCRSIHIHQIPWHFDTFHLFQMHPGASHMFMVVSYKEHFHSISTHCCWMWGT